MSDLLKRTSIIWLISGEINVVILLVILKSCYCVCLKSRRLCYCHFSLFFFLALHFSKISIEKLVFYWQIWQIEVIRSTDLYLFNRVNIWIFRIARTNRLVQKVVHHHYRKGDMILNRDINPSQQDKSLLTKYGKQAVHKVLSYFRLLWYWHHVTDVVWHQKMTWLKNL